MDINKFSIMNYCLQGGTSFYSKTITINYRSRTPIFIGYNIYTNKFVFGNQITNFSLTQNTNLNINKLDDTLDFDIYLEAPQVVKVNNVSSYPLGVNATQTRITHIYVPANLVDAYKTDTTSKWNTYADLIFPIPTE